MGNTFLYPHDKGAEALILLVRELLGLLADDLHTHGLDVQCAFSAKVVGLCGEGVEKVGVVPDVQLKIAVLKRDKRDLYLRDMPGCLFEERRAGFCCSHRNKVPLSWCRLPPVAKGCDTAGHGRELPAAAVHRQ